MFEGKIAVINNSAKMLFPFRSCTLVFHAPWRPGSNGEDSYKHNNEDREKRVP